MPTDETLTITINEHTLILPRAEAHALIANARHAMQRGGLLPISADTVIIATANTSISVTGSGEYEDTYRTMINSPVPNARKSQTAWAV